MHFSLPRSLTRLSQSHIQRGFTLVELIVVVAISGVLMAIALPDFVTTTRSIQLMHQAKEMESAIKFTRAEAQRRGQVVAMCRANTALNNCLTSGSPVWQGGWIIFNDVTPTGTITYDSSEDTLLAVKQPMPKGITVMAANGSGNRIVFNPAGEPAGAMGNSQTLTFSHDADLSVMNQVYLILSKAGRIRIATWADCQNGNSC